LQKQQSKLDAVMEHAADAMARQLKRALGGKASGGTVGAAATGGNRWGRTLVGEYAPELVDLPIGSRVHSGPDTQRMLSGGSGTSSQPLEITLIVGDTQLGTVLIDPLRRVIKGRGGNVQAVLGQRGK
jgi:trimeric autotransporter adhesin